MRARFRALGSFELTQRDLFVIFGDVLEGVVRAGMMVSLSLNQAVSISEPIHSVEYLDGPAVFHLALTFRLDQEARDMMKALHITNEELSLEG